MGDMVGALGRADPVNEATLQQQITCVRSRIKVLKLELPASANDDRTFTAVGTELRAKSSELDALKAGLKRLQIEARVEASRAPRRDAKGLSFVGRAFFRRANAARAK
jgi:hypothetical protein